MMMKMVLKILSYLSFMTLLVAAQHQKDLYRIIIQHGQMMNVLLWA